MTWLPTSASVNGISYLGDGGTTNYTEIKANGAIALHGTARYWIGFEIDAANFKEPAVGSATLVNRGLGIAYDFSDGNEEHIHAEMRITGRWDVTENLEVLLIWDSPATTKVCDWEIRYLFRALNEDMTYDTTAIAQAYGTSGSNANGLCHTTVVIPTAAFASGDKVLAFTVWRDGNDDNDTLSNSAFLHRLIVRGVANKLGGVVT